MLMLRSSALLGPLRILVSTVFLFLGLFFLCLPLLFLESLPLHFLDVDGLLSSLLLTQDSALVISEVASRAPG